MPKINGGFYLKARCVQSSYIAHAPPCVREIWDWLLMKAMHKDGNDLKRGQVLCTYRDIQEGLHWYVGFRKMVYSKWDCERTLKALVGASMVTTTKTTRGIVVTVVNYAKYQDIKNYESHILDAKSAENQRREDERTYERNDEGHNESHKHDDKKLLNTGNKFDVTVNESHSESHNEATMKPQTTDTIEKNDKELKNEKNVKNREGYGEGRGTFVPPTAEEVEAYCRERGNRVDAGRFTDFYTSKGWMVGRTKMRDWKAAVRGWEARESAESKQVGIINCDV